jgi:hypothetical protein
MSASYIGWVNPRTPHTLSLPSGAAGILDGVMFIAPSLFSLGIDDGADHRWWCSHGGFARLTWPA